FLQAEDGIRDFHVTGVQTCALPIYTIHAIRRNVDITYIVMDNQVYGLTKGQTSPRSEVGFKTKSTPMGSIESPLSPMEMALTVEIGRASCRERVEMSLVAVASSAQT